MRLEDEGQIPRIAQNEIPHQSLDEIDEWKKVRSKQIRRMHLVVVGVEQVVLIELNVMIEDILSSFGGAVCRESVFASDYEPQVAVFLRDRHSHALTLQLSSTPHNTRPNSVEKDIPIYESKYISIGQWLNTTVGIPNPKAHEIGEILVKNGYDRITQLNGCLTSSVLSSLGVDRFSQQQIMCYLESVKDVRPNANICNYSNDKTKKYMLHRLPPDGFNYISDWLCSLELTDYLGNFVTAGFKSMLIVRTAELTEDRLVKMSITLPGHISRILYSLKSARAEEVHHKMERAREMKRALSPEYATSTASTSIATKEGTPYSGVEEEMAESKNLLRGHTSFSAHYLGSMEISNIDGTEESRKAMTRLKKSIREIAKVPQVILEISIHGVRVLDGDTRCLTVEHEISRIQIVCQDERDLNCFTYISQDSDKNFCHVFCVLTADVATEIIVTLGQAFELAYKLQNRISLEEIVDV
uniref:Ankyrin repeat and SAM domain-containing protein 1A n=1 Tax=Heterorhabditis bacteriophora TaxID=37862 RepID=A0A1I7WGJ9_HETBA